MLWYIYNIYILYIYIYIFFKYLSLLSRSSKNSHLSHLCHWLGTWEFQAVKADLARKRVSTLRKPNQKWQPSVDAMLAASRPATIQIAWLAMCICTYIYPIDPPCMVYQPTFTIEINHKMSLNVVAYHGFYVYIHFKRDDGLHLTRF